MRCAVRKEGQREPAVLESKESTVAASLRTQPSLAVSPVGPHLQGHRSWKVGGMAAEGRHTRFSCFRRRTWHISEARGLVPSKAVSLNAGPARRCKHAGAQQGRGFSFCWGQLAKQVPLLYWDLERSSSLSPRNVWAGSTTAENQELKTIPKRSQISIWHYAPGQKAVLDVIPALSSGLHLQTLSRLLLFCLIWSELIISAAHRGERLPSPSGWTYLTPNVHSRHQAEWQKASRNSGHEDWSWQERIGEKQSHIRKAKCTDQAA